MHSTPIGTSYSGEIDFFLHTLTISARVGVGIEFLDIILSLRESHVGMHATSDKLS